MTTFLPVLILVINSLIGSGNHFYHVVQRQRTRHFSQMKCFSGSLERTEMIAVSIISRFNYVIVMWSVFCQVRPRLLSVMITFPGQFMWDLCWTKSSWCRLSPGASVFLFWYRSANSPYAFIHLQNCSWQEYELAKPEEPSFLKSGNTNKESFFYSS